MSVLPAPGATAVTQAGAGRPRLYTFEFVVLCLVILAAFCNTSVFYSFYHYLGDMGIPTVWRGFLVGIEPMVALVLRILMLPWLFARNATKVALASLSLLVVVSCSYLWATSVPTLIVLRTAHGAAFVLLTSAAVALVTEFIPKERSGQGFGVVGICTILPNAVIPFLSEDLLRVVGNGAVIYAGVSLFSIGAFILLLATRGRIGRALGDTDAAPTHRPSVSELLQNLRYRPVLLLLGVSFLAYIAHATVFYFLKDLSIGIGEDDVGLFLMVCMLTMIAVRALGGAAFDRIDRLQALGLALLLMAACLAALPSARTSLFYFLLAAGYGLSVGVAMPLLNASLSSSSRPHLRGSTVIMGLCSMDAAYCAAPYLGGMLVALGAGFGSLFYVASASAAITVGMVFVLARSQRTTSA